MDQNIYVYCFSEETKNLFNNYINKISILSDKGMNNIKLKHSNINLIISYFSDIIDFRNANPIFGLVLKFDIKSIFDNLLDNRFENLKKNFFNRSFNNPKFIILIINDSNSNQILYKIQDIIHKQLKIELTPLIDQMVPIGIFYTSYIENTNNKISEELKIFFDGVQNGKIKYEEYRYYYTKTEYTDRISHKIAEEPPNTQNIDSQMNMYHKLLTQLKNQKLSNENIIQKLKQFTDTGNNLINMNKKIITKGDSLSGENYNRMLFSVNDKLESLNNLVITEFNKKSTDIIKNEAIPKGIRSIIFHYQNLYQIEIDDLKNSINTEMKQLQHLVNNQENLQIGINDFSRLDRNKQLLCGKYIKTLKQLYRLYLHNINNMSLLQLEVDKSYSSILMKEKEQIYNRLVEFKVIDDFIIQSVADQELKESNINENVLTETDNSIEKLERIQAIVTNNAFSQIFSINTKKKIDTKIIVKELFNIFKDEKILSILEQTDNIGSYENLTNIFPNYLYNLLLSYNSTLLNKLLRTLLNFIHKHGSRLNELLTIITHKSDDAEFIENINSLINITSLSGNNIIDLSNNINTIQDNPKIWEKIILAIRDYRTHIRQISTICFDNDETVITLFLANEYYNKIWDLIEINPINRISDSTKYQYMVEYMYIHLNTLHSGILHNLNTNSELFDYQTGFNIDFNEMQAINSDILTTIKKLIIYFPLSDLSNISQNKANFRDKINLIYKIIYNYYNNVDNLENTDLVDFIEFILISSQYMSNNISENSLSHYNVIKQFYMMITAINNWINQSKIWTMHYQKNRIEELNREFNINIKLDNITEEIDVLQNMLGIFDKKINKILSISQIPVLSHVISIPRFGIKQRIYGKIQNTKLIVFKCSDCEGPVGGLIDKKLSKWIQIMRIIAENPGFAAVTINILGISTKIININKIHLDEISIADINTSLNEFTDSDSNKNIFKDIFLDNRYENRGISSIDKIRRKEYKKLSLEEREILTSKFNYEIGKIIFDKAELMIRDNQIEWVHTEGYCMKELEKSIFLNNPLNLCYYLTKNNYLSELNKKTIDTVFSNIATNKKYYNFIIHVDKFIKEKLININSDEIPHIIMDLREYVEFLYKNHPAN